MDLEEYLAKEKISSEIASFVKQSKKVLPENLWAELEQVTDRIIRTPHQLNELYEFNAKNGLFPLLWRLNRQKIVNNTYFVLKQGINGCKKVLDVGCSDGLKTVYYAMTCPEAQITGIDRCKGPILQAKEKAEKYGIKNIKFIHADLSKSCFKNDSFDSIIATQVLHETFYMAYGFDCFDGMQAYYEFDSQLKEMARILSPGGRLLISLRVRDDCRHSIAGQVKYAAEKAGLKEKKISGDHKNNRNAFNRIYTKPE